MYCVAPHSFASVVELRFAVSSKATSCIKATDEIADNGHTSVPLNQRQHVPFLEATPCAFKIWSVFRSGSSGTSPMYVGIVPKGLSPRPLDRFLKRREAATGLRSRQMLRMQQMLFLVAAQT